MRLTHSIPSSSIQSLPVLPADSWISRILWNSMTSTSFVFTELANKMITLLHNLIFAEWHHYVSHNEVWGRGCYITLFSPSDVTAFHRICAMSSEPPSYLANSGRPKNLNDLSATSILQSVNRWRHNEYSCCSHPSFSYRRPTHMLSRSDRWSDGLTWWGKVIVYALCKTDRQYLLTLQISRYCFF